MSLHRDMEECRVDGGTTLSHMGGQEARATSCSVDVVASGSPWIRAGHIVAQQCPTGGQEATPELGLWGLSDVLLEDKKLYQGISLVVWRGMGQQWRPAGRLDTKVRLCRKLHD